MHCSCFFFSRDRLLTVLVLENSHRDRIERERERENLRGLFSKTGSKNIERDRQTREKVRASKKIKIE